MQSRSVLSAPVRDGHGQVRQLRWQIRLTCIWIAALMLVGGHIFLRPGERAVVDAMPGLLALSALADTAAGAWTRSWGRIRHRRSPVDGLHFG